MLRSHRRRAGFTLTELMVSVALLGLVTVYLTGMLTRQSRTYTVVDEVTEAQQNLRALGDLLEKEARSTGFLVPEHAAFCGIDRTQGTDFVVVTDSDAMDPTNQSNADLAAEVIAGYAGTGIAEVITIDTLSPDGNPFYDTDGNGVADSDFLFSAAPNPARNGGVIVVDRANPDRGVSCGMLIGLGANTLTVDFSFNNNVPGGGGRPLAALTAAMNAPDIVAIPAHIYSVNANQLLRDGMLLADEVEDLQFALFFDLDDDGQVASEALEYPGAPTGAVYQPNAWDHEFLREIRINVITRTSQQDADVMAETIAPQGQFQSTENRVAPAGNDGFRRRVLTAVVRPRNVGARSIGS